MGTSIITDSELQPSESIEYQLQPQCQLRWLGLKKLFTHTNRNNFDVCIML